MYTPASQAISQLIFLRNLVKTKTIISNPTHGYDAPVRHNSNTRVSFISCTRTLCSFVILINDKNFDDVKACVVRSAGVGIAKLYRVGTYCSVTTYARV